MQVHAASQVSPVRRISEAVTGLSCCEGPERVDLPEGNRTDRMSYRVPQASEPGCAPQWGICLVHCPRVIRDLLVQLGLGSPILTAFGDVFLSSVGKR